MAEGLPSQSVLQETAIREVENLLNSKLQGMTETMSKLDDKLDAKMAEIFEAIQLLTTSGAGASSSGDRNTASASQILQPPQTGNRIAPSMCPDNPRMRNPHFPHNPFAANTKLSRLDFPRFNGDRDRVKDWLIMCDQFFIIDRTPPEIKVNLASIHLDDEAAGWHQSVMLSEDSNYLLGDWNAYTVLLLERFGEVIDDPIAELKNLQETDGILAYHCKFEVIRNRVQMPESCLVSAYLAGLRKDTQMNVKMFHPHTIRQCLMLAKLYEAAHPSMEITNVNSKFNNSLLSHSTQRKEGATVSKPMGTTPLRLPQIPPAIPLNTYAAIQKLSRLDFPTDDGSLVGVLNETTSVKPVHYEGPITDECSDDELLCGILTMKSEIDDELLCGTVAVCLFEEKSEQRSCKTVAEKCLSEILDDFVAIEVLQPPLHVRDMLIHDARMDDGVSDGVIAETLSSNNFCIQGIRRNAYETLSSLLPPAKPPDEFINVLNVLQCKMSDESRGFTSDWNSYKVSQHVIHKDIETILSDFEDIFHEPIQLQPSQGDHDLTAAKQHYTWVHTQLRQKGKLVVGSDTDFKLHILRWLQCKLMMFFSMEDFADESDSWCSLENFVDDWLGVRLNALAKWVFDFLRAKPPDMNMNGGTILNWNTTVQYDICFGECYWRTHHGLVLSSIQPDLLHLLYRDSLNEDAELLASTSTSTSLGDTLAAKLLAEADKYELGKLRLMCESLLCKDISVNSVAKILALADHYHALELKAMCLKFADENLVAVMRSDGFEYLKEKCSLLQSALLKKIVGCEEEASAGKKAWAQLEFEVMDCTRRYIILERGRSLFCFFSLPRPPEVTTFEP